MQLIEGVLLAAASLRSRNPTTTYPTARERLLHYVQVKFSAVSPQILNLRFQGVGLGG